MMRSFRRRPCGERRFEKKGNEAESMKGFQLVLFTLWSKTGADTFCAAVSGYPHGLEVGMAPWQYYPPDPSYASNPLQSDNVTALLNLAGSPLRRLTVHLSFHDHVNVSVATLKSRMMDVYNYLILPLSGKVVVSVSPQLEDEWSDAHYYEVLKALVSVIPWEKNPPHFQFRRSFTRKTGHGTGPVTAEYTKEKFKKTITISRGSHPAPTVRLVTEAHGTLTDHESADVYSNDGDLVWCSDPGFPYVEGMSSTPGPPVLPVSDVSAFHPKGNVLLWRPAYNLYRPRLIKATVQGKTIANFALYDQPKTIPDVDQMVTDANNNKVDLGVSFNDFEKHVARKFLGLE
jgi:hypothetical protein